MGTTLKFLSENTVRKCTFGKPQPPKIIIKIEGREVTGEVDEEVASVLQSVSQQLSSDTSRWDRLLDGEE